MTDGREVEEVVDEVEIVLPAQALDAVGSDVLLFDLFVEQTDGLVLYDGGRRNR